MTDVSVVLPCYNAHAFLDRAIESVRAQSVPVAEILVVDDGSTDPETRAHLDGLGADVTVIRQQNRGLAGARNAGFEAASGRLVLPLDCDDWLAPDFVARTTALLGDDEMAFAFTWLALEGELSGALAKGWNLYEQLMFNQLPYCMLIPRALWRRVGGYDETMRLGYEDWEFNIRLGLAGAEGRVVEAPLFHYQVSGGGMLAAVSQKRHSALWGQIRRKHAAAYRRSSLARLRRDWAGRPSTYPPALLAGWDLAYRLLPDPLFDRLFRALLGYRHSRRERR